MPGRVPIPDRDPRTLRTHKTSTFVGKPMPNLSAGEVICPVCDHPGIKMLPDGKPGVRYRHEGGMFVCRELDGGV